MTTVNVGLTVLRHQGHPTSKWYAVYSMENMAINRWGAYQSNGTFAINKHKSLASAHRAAKLKVDEKIAHGYLVVSAVGYEVSVELARQVYSARPGSPEEVFARGEDAIYDSALAANPTTPPPVHAPRVGHPDVTSMAEALLRDVHRGDGVDLEHLLESWGRLDAAWADLDATHQHVGPIVANIRKKVAERLLGGAT